MFLVYVVLCFIVFGCQYQCNRLPGKTRLRNDLLCVKWDVKPYTLTHSLIHCSGKEHGAEAEMVSGDQEADHRELSQVDTWPSKAGCAWWRRRWWERQITNRCVYCLPVSRCVYLWSGVFNCEQVCLPVNGCVYLWSGVFTCDQVCSVVNSQCDFRFDLFFSFSFPVIF